MQGVEVPGQARAGGLRGSFTSDSALAAEGLEAGCRDGLHEVYSGRLALFGLLILGLLLRAAVDLVSLAVWLGAGL